MDAEPYRELTVALAAVWAAHRRLPVDLAESKFGFYIRNWLIEAEGVDGPALAVGTLELNADWMSYRWPDDDDEMQLRGLDVVLADLSHSLWRLKTTGWEALQTPGVTDLVVGDPGNQLLSHGGHRLAVLRRGGLYVEGRGFLNRRLHAPSHIDPFEARDVLFVRLAGGARVHLNLATGCGTFVDPTFSGTHIDANGAERKVTSVGHVALEIWWRPPM